MLVDFRSHIIRHAGLNATADGADLGAYWAAVRHLLARGWFPSEYANLLGFAYASPKWRDAYEWQIAGHDGLDTWPALSTGAHWRGAECPAPPLTVRDREPAVFAPASRAVLFWPSSVSSAVGWPEFDGFNRGWKALRGSGMWAAYVTARQATLAAYAASHRYISAAELCGAGIKARWNACFDRHKPPGMGPPAPFQVAGGKALIAATVPRGRAGALQRGALAEEPIGRA